MLGKFVVKEPVVDLRREPSRHSGKYERDALQETQLFFDESLLGYEEKEGWIRVEALEQLCFKAGWCGYPGWVRSSQVEAVDFFQEKALVISAMQATLHVDICGPSFCSLSFGTKLALADEHPDWWQVRFGDGKKGFLAKSEAEIISTIRSRDERVRRSTLVELGKKMRGFPYLWGGRSTYNPASPQLTSTDCSGFSSLLYRVAHGMEIPRDAHDQFLSCRPCETHELKLGDLVFLASLSNPDRMNHVMLYAGEDALLEATEQTSSIQQTTFKNKLGEPLSALSHGGRIGEYFVFFGYILS